MNLRTGVDLIEISRLSDAVSRYGDRFLARIYTPAELELCAGRVESLAGRFAAKEAVAKALGCGIGEVGWTHIEILSDRNKAPVLHLHGQAVQKAEELGLSSWSLSLSHGQTQAVAFVVAMGAG